VKATSWEFENRALLFGMIFTLGFMLYFLTSEISPMLSASGWGTGRTSPIGTSVEARNKDLYQGTALAVPHRY
jgi:hypothetical protein